ncbi:CDP-diacylglycerol--serine O-phosphatidyltransferase [Haloplasma contractile]|uniref:Phosphatidylserine synthase protein n=1 Tax=Haloplasma contractile SSD-17B TaxID=1033810 RepID=U2FL64_9MOLU|nr:CDP-diacylglycerol--serine O-phosphatidyltransferase [Haloplasma contractile]ERJ11944.1 Phosphatidylserine synthase protein [Haloplasma contractile SSD-17B]
MSAKQWLYANLANAITIVNLISGICAIILIMDDQLKAACIFILIGMVADGLDGKVAYLLNTSSEIGKQLDSLCDVITFGLAPSLLIYKFYFVDIGIVAISVSCIFVVASVVRLARYNVMEASDHFKGLPITIAGGFLISLVLVDRSINDYMVMIIVSLLAILMVSSITYNNFKQCIKHLNPKIVAVLLLFIVLGGSLFRGKWLIALLFVYIIHGIVITVFNKMMILLNQVKNYKV